METELNKAVLNELQEIKSDLHYIKIHLVDVDMVMTEEDISALQEAEKDLKEGKTKRLN